MTEEKTKGDQIIALEKQISKRLEEKRFLTEIEAGICGDAIHSLSTTFSASFLASIQNNLADSAGFALSLSSAVRKQVHLERDYTISLLRSLHKDLQELMKEGDMK